MKYVKRIVAGIKAAKAFNLVTEGQFEIAEIELCKAEDMANGLPTEELILKGFIKFQLKKYDQALEPFEKAWQQLQNDNKMLNSDRKYLMLYVSDLAIFCSKKSRKKLEHIKSVAWSDVDMPRVSNRIKKRFPNKDHPDY